MYLDLLFIVAMFNLCVFKFKLSLILNMLVRYTILTILCFPVINLSLYLFKS